MNASDSVEKDNQSPSAQDIPSNFDVSAIVDAITEKGLALYEARGLSESHLEALYAHGYGLYGGGRIEEAENIFLALCLYDHLNSRYWQALGSAQLVLKKFNEAAYAFSYCGLIDPESPVNPLRAAECQTALGNSGAAVEACEAAILLSKDRPEFEEIHKKATAYKALIAGA